jgi:hypothetical protein
VRVFAAGVSLLLMLAVHLAAHGQGHIYSCKDKSGRTLTSDQPIPECANLPMEERSKSGILMREIPAPLTPAQVAAQEEAARKQREADDEARDQHRRDLLLMSTYTDEHSIEVARGRAAQDFEDSLKAARERLDELLSDRESLKKETLPYKNKPLPPGLQRRIDASDAEIAGQSKTIEDRKADIARINARFDADLKRFREIDAGNTSGVRH